MRRENVPITWRQNNWCGIMIIKCHSFRSVGVFQSTGLSPDTNIGLHRALIEVT